MENLILITIFFYILAGVGYFLFLSSQKHHFYKAGLYCVITGFLFHTAIMILKILASKQMPVHNLFETILTAAWSITAVFIFFDYKFKLKILGIFAAPMIIFIMSSACIIADNPVEIKKILGGFWLNVHIISIFIGEAAFILACGAGIFYLIQEHGIKRKKRGYFYTRLPALSYMDAVCYSCVITGFVMVTTGLASGFVYAKIAWGHFWTWDPKEIWSILTWLFYAVLLHGKLALGWRGKRFAIMTIIGVIFILFTFLGVNFLFEGHHKEFTG
jgi:cytochrome c-type biogenesis protein CcsB